MQRGISCFLVFLHVYYIRMNSILLVLSFTCVCVWHLHASVCVCGGSTGNGLISELVPAAHCFVLKACHYHKVLLTLRHKLVQTRLGVYTFRYHSTYTVFLLSSVFPLSSIHHSLSWTCSIPFLSAITRVEISTLAQLRTPAFSTLSLEPSSLFTSSELILIVCLRQSLVGCSISARHSLILTLPFLSARDRPSY